MITKNTLKNSLNFECKNCKAGVKELEISPKKSSKRQLQTNSLSESSTISSKESFMMFLTPAPGLR